MGFFSSAAREKKVEKQGEACPAGMGGGQGNAGRKGGGKTARGCRRETYSSYSRGTKRGRPFQMGGSTLRIVDSSRDV